MKMRVANREGNGKTCNQGMVSGGVLDWIKRDRCEFIRSSIDQPVITPKPDKINSHLSWIRE
ncbi:MAG: hypothetical protein BWY80_00278 [Firmicutes bacterium ADurb.Bin456]|nr:MAG: hypothetical protein BWY80_00278 [Firmicutes bacterium ADurb.Bin456]